MANPITLPGDLTVPDNLRLSGSISPAKTRTEILALSDLKPFVVPWTLWRVWNALETNLPGTAAADDLALVGGTFGSASPSIQTDDFGGSSIDKKARAQIPLPWEYIVGETVTLRFHAGMLTTVAESACELDVECYETDEETGVSGDICTTGATSINSLIFEDKDFVITPTALSPGDLLDVRISIIASDGTDLGVMIGCIGAVKLLCDVR